MPVLQRDENVFDAALDRIIKLYEDGHKVVVSFSGGKDSTVCLEMTIIAAKLTGNLPVDVIMRDEEIMFPGTFEYCERVVQREEVRFHWLIANQPIINIFNRKSPYFWVFDPAIPQEEWVRQPPSYAKTIPEKNIQALVHKGRFPTPEGKDLFTIIGLRTQESVNRKMGLHSSKGYTTKKNAAGARLARPIYDWGDNDVWKAINDNKWDYNEAYNVMYRLGVPRRNLRIAPPTLTLAGVDHLALASKAWPQWFDKVCIRLPGIRTAANFGKRSVAPFRKLNETWSECFERTCIKEAPDWISERAIRARDYIIAAHNKHSTEDFPEVSSCPQCGQHSSWRALTNIMYMGDPFSMKVKLPYVEPEFFRPGAGTWGGTPQW